MTEWPRISALGDQALLIEFEPVIDIHRNRQLHALARHLSSLFAERITDSVASYHSLAIFYRQDCVSYHDIERAVLAWKFSAPSAVQPARTINIPVCYDLSLALDLEALAGHCQLSVAEVISRHTTPDYHVHFLGFKPGFAYLGGLDARLSMPRHATPRLLLPAGSVGIGGSQTGIYPQAGPGGWQIIGRTPVSLFDPEQTPPCRLQAGDSLRFTSIALDAYFALGGTS